MVNFFVVRQRATNSPCQPPFSIVDVRFSNAPLCYFLMPGYTYSSIDMTPAPYVRNITLTVETPECLAAGDDYTLSLIVGSETFDEALDRLADTVAVELKSLRHKGVRYSQSWTDKQGLSWCTVWVRVRDGPGRERDMCGRLRVWR
tara:strand:+ start:9037 stop:9474 length:438 start_codon:yes stop_codon:yes gene_type:complete